MENVAVEEEVKRKPRGALARKFCLVYSVTVPEARISISTRFVRLWFGFSALVGDGRKRESSRADRSKRVIVERSR
jgi:hypothetical protein